MIAAKVSIAGSAKADGRWMPMNAATIGFDHATQVWAEHALRLDVFDTERPDAGHIAVEMDLESGRALLATLAEVIAEAEATGLTDQHGMKAPPD